MSDTKPNIAGLIVKPLRRFIDERGDFREIIRSTDPDFPGFSQLSSSVVYQGIAKAWHMHLDQTELMTNYCGVVKFAFADRREGSATYGKVADFLIDAQNNPSFFIVPPGVAHGYRVVVGPAVVGYLANRIYDPSDQIKIPHNDPAINYNWGPPEIV
ncbi:MAG: dTDP-4-dehydrorhamnose 3,5-epimerase family protein [Oligoflexales bacterium]